MEENKDTIKIEVNRNKIIRWLFLLGCYAGCCACFWQLCYEWDALNGATKTGWPVAIANFKVGRLIIYAIGVHLFATLIYREHTRDRHKE